MKIGGENDPRAIRKEHWEAFAREAGIKPRLVISRLTDMAKRIKDVRLEIFKGPFAPYASDALYRLMELLGDNEEKTLRRFS